MIKDYFENISDYVINRKYNVIDCKKTIKEPTDINVYAVLGYELAPEVQYIYNHYNEFILAWENAAGKYLGQINFVAFADIEKEHRKLVAIMEAIYDTRLDDLNIYQSIINLYPLFCFANGDAFCLDKRDGSIRFYDHEVYDGMEDVGIFGVKIANSINDLFEKWGQLHFADVYYWDEVCNEDGIDVKSELAQRFID